LAEKPPSAQRVHKFCDAGTDEILYFLTRGFCGCTNFEVLKIDMTPTLKIFDVVFIFANKRAPFRAKTQCVTDILAQKFEWMTQWHWQKIPQAFAPQKLYGVSESKARKL
jgi:hypothetical protein